MTSLPPSSMANRRHFFGQVSAPVLSAAALGLLAGHSPRALAAMQSPGSDVGILNAALALEHEAIGAYQLGAESGLLTKPTLSVALLFQGHHKAHRDALIGTIEKLGGTPVAATSLKELGMALQANTLQNQNDVLALARRLEGGAANAYLSLLPSFKDAKLGAIAARLAADETMHWTALTQALGLALPSAALSFGA